MTEAMKARLEELSDKVRMGIPINFAEALEVIAYQESLKAVRLKTWLGRLRLWFRDA
jgi:hypothetical protein